MKDILKRIGLGLSGLVMVWALASPAPAAALFESAKRDACSGTQLNDATAECPDTGGQVNGLLRTAINIFSVVIGFIAVIMIIISGLRYVTSAGDSNAVNGAKNTLLYAVIGLIIVVLSQVIVRFVLAKTATPACPPGITNGIDLEGNPCRMP